MAPFRVECLNAEVEKLRIDGWKVIVLERRSPHAIAVRDGKVVAVVVVAEVHRKNKGWRPEGGYTFKEKRALYDMFDDVHIVTYRKSVHPDRPELA